MKFRAGEHHPVVLAAVAFLGLLQSATAQLTYDTNNGAITITGYTGFGPAVTIPGTLNGHPVTAIGNAAFGGAASVTSVSIPNSVTNIGAFAFTASGLTGVTIPSSVIYIGQDAFAACNSLSNITVNAGGPAYTSLNGVLFDKAQHTLIQYPAALTNDNYTIPGTVTTIGDDAFYSASGVGSVTIPNSVSAIGNDAFAYCIALDTVYFGGNAPNVGSFAFYETGFGSGVTVNYLPGTTGWQAFSAAPGQSLAAFMFWYQPGPEILTFEPTFGVETNQFRFTISWATNATLVVEACTNLANPAWVPIFTNTVTATIGTTNFTDPQWGSFRTRFYRVQTGLSDFAYSTSLGAITITGYSGTNDSITIPATINGYPVTGIGSGAFADDTTVTNVIIPGSVTNIGDFAFKGSGLINVTLPASVISLGESVFGLCDSLTNISVSATNPAYSSLGGVLFDKGQHTLIQYPGGSTAGDYTVPSGVTAIGDDAFYGTFEVGNVTIPNSVTSIGDDAFAYCGALNAVYFGGNAPSVGSFSFYDTDFGSGIIVNYRPGTTGWPAFSAALGQSLAASIYWYQPAPEALTFEPTFGVHNNQFGFTISWATNATVVVDACTNLSNPVWLPISTNTVIATIGTTNFTDAQWKGYSKRYYRLHSP